MTMLLAMGAANLWLWWQYPEAMGISRRPELLLAAVVSLLLVGFGLQAFALWRLQPDATRPSPSVAPSRSSADLGTSDQRPGAAPTNP
jgi:hypothetical protein